MPYILKEKETSQVATALLVNTYDLTYYGTKYWEDLQIAEQEMKAFLQAQGINDSSMWEIIEVEELTLKKMNVKLKNDPRLRLFMYGDGKLHVQS